MTVNELYFTPLGGAGEIGMNMSLYGYEGEWLMVDMGIGFADSAANGVDVFTPDPSFIIEERDRLVGLVITHAHEDHLGGIPYLWDKIRCPIYATPFAMSLLRRKLDDVGLLKQVNLYEIPVGGMSTIGKFSVDFISAAHSVPEGNILAIRCAAGVVVHATDWKIDPNPLVGRQTDEKALRQVGDEGVLALVCDSTNVFVEGESGSEGLLRQSLKKIIANCTGRVAVACFASNIARLETINRVANETGRHAALVGRSLWRNTEISIENGYLQGIEPFVSEEEISFFPANKILLGVTGSQGEPRSALTRIARGKHRNVSLQAGDTVIFSSREIPGNELAIANVQNQLVRQGVEVLTEQDGFVHVSGHPARDELREMYRWVRPKILVPIHGEHRHLTEHCWLGEQSQIPHARVVENGNMAALSQKGIKIVDEVAVGRLAIDGSRLVSSESSVIFERKRLLYNGVALVTVIAGPRGDFRAEPEVSLEGVLDTEIEEMVYKEVVDAIKSAMKKLGPDEQNNDDFIIKMVKRTVRKALSDAIGKRPVTKVHVVRI